MVYYTQAVSRATAINMTNQNDPSRYHTGDLVIGSTDPNKSVYSATGARLVPNGVVVYGSPEDIEAQAEELTQMAIRYGGKKIQDNSTAKTKKKTKSKIVSSTVSTEPRNYQERQESPVVPHTKITSSPQTVQFENDFGKIKVRVEALVEHTQAYMLVFPDETSIIFEPKIGEILKFHTSYTSEEVYYPGVIFNSPADSAQFMILFKVPQENQE